MEKAEQREASAAKEEEVSITFCTLDVGGVPEVLTRVLVVDDSLVERRLVEGLLKNTPHMCQVIAVDSARRAMEVLGLSVDKTESPTVEEQKIDLILTDYCMPEMTGYDLLKVVKEQSSHKHIPVVIMSSQNEPLRTSRCRATGAEDFIIKPLQMEDVLRLMSYARPASAASPRTKGTKRKMSVESIAEKSASESKPRLTGLAAA